VEESGTAPFILNLHTKLTEVKTLTHRSQLFLSKKASACRCIGCWMGQRSGLGASEKTRAYCTFRGSKPHNCSVVQPRHCTEWAATTT